MSRKRHPVDPTRETCEPVPMTPDGILIRAAGAPVKGLTGTAKLIERVVMDLPKARLNRPLPRCPYTGEV